MSSLPCTTPPLSYTTFFIGIRGNFTTTSTTRQGEKERGTSHHYNLFLYLGNRSDRRRFYLRPFPGIIICTGVSIPTLIMRLPRKRTNCMTTRVLRSGLRDIQITLYHYRGSEVKGGNFFQMTKFIAVHPVRRRFPPSVFLTTRGDLSTYAMSYFSACQATPRSQYHSFPQGPKFSRA